MENVLLVVQLILAFALIAVILFQRTAQDGGGLVGGGSTMGGLFTAKGSANLLTHTTAILATAFILNSLALGYIASSQHQNRSVIDQLTPEVPASAKPESAPVPTSSSETPATAPEQKAPPAPPASQQKEPAAPQVPLGQ